MEKKTISVLVEKSLYELLFDIINSKMEYNIDYVKRLIIIAENEDFTVAQSKILMPWLLRFATEHRNDVGDMDATYSAIRTAASMMHPNEVEMLFPFLEKEQDNRVALVTIKMIGRIFEAQPPSKMGEYENLAEKIHDFVSPMLDDYLVMLTCQDAATAQLCATSIVAMGSEKIYPILEKVKNKEGWFKKYVLRNVKVLRKTWQSRISPIDYSLVEFLNKVIKTVEGMTSDTL